MINCEHPETGFSDDGEINLGEIKRDTTISIGIINPYNSPDSISISWSGRSISTSKLEIDPINLRLDPLSQYNILCTIRASAMAANSYTVALKMSRYFTLDPASQYISKIVRFTVPTVSSVDESGNKFNYILSQNYPNPFNPSTKIKYSIANGSQVEIVIFDILGKEITKIVNEYKNAGSYEVSFNASEIPSGIYYYRLKAGSYSSIKKLVVLK